MDSASGGGRTSSTPRGVKSGNMGLVKFQSVESVSSGSSVPPHSPHPPLGQVKYSTEYSLAWAFSGYSISLVVKVEVGLYQHTRVISGARCPILPRQKLDSED